MSKTIEQLRAEAALIEDAVRQGENTQVRVGGLFQDIIDFIAQIPITETVLGPLLQALNNSELINPGDGQTLTFSLIKEGWTFSDALTQLQIRLGQVSSTVTSNYEAFLQTKDLLQAEVAAIDERVRNYKTQYDQSQIEYATWKSQTDTSISQYAVAIDRNTRSIVSISGRVDTAFDQLDFVTNDLEAAEKNIGKIFDLAGMNLSDEPSASWLYKNKDGIYGAAATFDASGNIKDLSTLDLTIKGFNTRVTNAEGQISQINQTVDSMQLAIASDQQQITTLNGYINGTAGNPGLIQRMSSAENKLSVDEAELNRHASAIEINRQGIAAVSAKFNPDGSLANTSGLVVSSDFSTLFTEAYDDTGAQNYMAQLRTDLNGISAAVGRDETQINNLKNAIEGTDSNPGIATRLGAVESKSDQSASWINQHRNKIELVVGEFDSTGKLTNTAGLVTTSSFSGLFAEAYDETGAATTMAQMNVELVKKLDENGVERVISKAKIQADQIEMDSKNWNAWVDNFGVSASHISMDAVTFDLWASDYLQLTADDISFNFRKEVKWTARGTYSTKDVMILEPDGDLWIEGTFKGKFMETSVSDTMEIGTGVRRFIIEPSEKQDRAAIMGYNSSEMQLFLGWASASDQPSFALKQAGFSTEIIPGLILLSSNATYLSGAIAFEGGKLTIGSYYGQWDTSIWPKYSDVRTGQMYMEDDGNLRVKL